ncbi:MAG: hypothetical protein E6995_14885 [Enterobacteriaceae bacterium]|uniref:hypothetical protein n=1 Tax=Hafnia paralvei TaxID=546367 RepID=UPI000EBAB32F|nr:hypothetical protein [Hafnia paralvei]MDU1193415.1 hypothetical protein [Enterobacteriaceae bacterium]MDU1245510.1 hypothetical protein [Enterobacteriaceae bacterium]HCU14682.1 hypothetical protein [Hafnia paralvei]
MEITTINQLIAAGSGLIGACIGAGISSWVNYRISSNNHDIEKLSFAAGFIAEVEALQTIIKERRYLESFISCSNHPDILDGGEVQYKILIPDDFARFYNANLNKVGLLGVERTRLLVQYHQILQSIAQDFKDGSYVSINGFDKEAIDECIRLFRLALSIGEQIINYEVRS